MPSVKKFRMTIKSHGGFTQRYFSVIRKIDTYGGSVRYRGRRYSDVNLAWYGCVSVGIRKRTYKKCLLHLRILHARQQVLVSIEGPISSSPIPIAGVML